MVTVPGTMSTNHLPKAGRRFGPFLIAIGALFVAAAGGAGIFLFTALRGTGHE